MAANARVCQVNSATTIADPGTSTDGFGVKTKRNIYIIAATKGFTANSVACNPGDVGVNFGDNPFLVTGAVSGATVGSIWYYIA
jgi:hypothetical protein|tara:strand:+ start:129 stop:380 length:252 start_codon:yes stop_codon:yes gene_type:complete